MIRLWKLSLHFIKQNKKRVLLSGIGISLSVVLISSVIFLSDTYSTYQKESTTYSDGTWILKNPSKLESNIDAALSLAPLKENVTISTIASSPLAKEQYIQIEAHSNFQGIYPFHLKEGNYPQSEQEIVVTPEYLTTQKLSINSTISLTIGHRYVQNQGQQMIIDDTNDLFPNERFEIIGKKTYTIVGTYLDNTNSNGTATKYKFVTKGTLPSSIATTYYTIDPIDKQKWQQILSQINEDAQYCVNQNAVDLYVKEEVSLSFSHMIVYTLILLILASHMIGLIKNMFAISLQERSTIFGTLQCIGATPKQIRIIVLLEAWNIALVAIPIGFIFSIGLLTCLYNNLSETLMTQTGILVPFRLHVRPLYLLFITLFVLCVLTISTWFPTRKIFTYTPMQLIKRHTLNPYTTLQNKQSKKKRNIIKTIGLRYQQVNRKAYRAIIFSMCTSMILFLSGNYVINNWISSQKNLSTSKNTVIVQLNDTGNIAQFQQMLEVEDALYAINPNGTNYTETFMNVDIYMPQQYFSELAKETILINNSLDYTISLAISNQLQGESKGEIRALIDGFLSYQTQDNENEDIAIFNFHKGDHLTLPYRNYANDQITIEYLSLYIENTNFEVKETMKPNDTKNDTIISNITFYISLEDYMELLTIFHQQGLLTRSSHTIYMQNQNPKTLLEPLNKYAMQHSDSIRFINDPTTETINPLFIAMRLLLNMFSIFILFICIMNIINIVLSSILTRKKEIAVLESIGMENHQILRMLITENLKYIWISLGISILLSLGINYTLYSLDFLFSVPFFDIMPYNILLVILASLVIVLFTILISFHTLRKESLIDKIRSIDF